VADVLEPDALHQSLAKLPGWEGTTDGMAKEYVFDDFAGAMAFVNAVADQAEAVNHHPDITISWNRVRLTLVTHSAGGVTQADVDLAGRIDGTEAR
jgi:4a-hydroxytetrahydrobiopterin dehydratase